MLKIEKDCFTLDCAIPLSYWVTADGEFKMEAYKCAANVAKKFAAKYKNDPFSEEAKDFIDSQLHKIVESYGYMHDPKSKGELVSMQLAAVDESRILPSTKLITSPDGFGNATSYPFDMDCDEDDVYAVTVIDGEIVSVASINSYPEGSARREIAVQTAPDYRNRGFAVSNVAALSKFLHDKGYVVDYRCSVYNDASIATAKAAGFVEVSRSYHYVCYAI
jgi:hypothetical protein